MPADKTAEGAQHLIQDGKSNAALASGGVSLTGTTDVAEAREYIAIFREHTLPGAQWVDTNERRIQLDNMSDADALFVAREFQRMEAEAARRSLKQRRVQ